MTSRVETNLAEKALWNRENPEAVFAQIRMQLASIKESLPKLSTESQKSDVQRSLKDFLVQLKNVNISDHSKLDVAINWLNEWVDTAKIEHIETIVEDMNSKKQELKKADIDKLKESLSFISSSKQELSHLFQNTIEQKKQELRSTIIKKAEQSFFWGFIVSALDDIEKSKSWAKRWFMDTIIDWFKMKFWYPLIFALAWVGEYFEQFVSVISWNVIDKAKEVWQKTLDYTKEQLDAFKLKLKDQFRSYVKIKLWKKDISDEKLNWAIDEYFAENEGSLQIERFLKNVKENWEWEYKVLDWFLDGIKWWWLMVKFFWKMMEKWIISLDEIALSTWEDFIAYGKISLSLIKDSFSKLTWSISWDELSSNIDKMNLTDWEKQLITFMIYRKWWIFFNFAWNLAWFMTKWLLYPFAFVGQDVSQVWARWSAFSWNYAKQLDIIEKISSKVDLWPSSESIKILKSTFWDLSDFYKFWWWYQENESAFKSSWKQFWEFIKTWPSDIQEIANKILKSQELGFTDTKNLRWILSNHCNSIWWKLEKSTWDFISKVWEKFKWWLSEKYVYQSFWEEISRATKSLSEIVRNDELFGLRSIKKQFVDKVRLWESLSQQIGLSDNLILAFKDVNDFKAWSEELKILLRKTPDAAKMLFGKMPIIAVAWIEMSKDNPTFASISQSMMWLIPLIWPAMLMSWVWIKYSDWKINIQWDLTSAMLWLWLFWYDTFYIAKAAWLNGFKWVMKAMAQPLTDVAELWMMISRWWLYWFKFAKDTVKIAKNEWVIEMFKYSWETLADVFKWIKWWKLASKPALVAYTLMLVWWWYYAYEKWVFDSEIEKELKRLSTEWVSSWDFEKYQSELLSMRKDMSNSEKTQQFSNLIKIRASLMGLGNISDSDIKFDWKNLSISMKKLLPAVQIAQFKEDLYQRLKTFGLLQDWSVISVDLHTRSIIENIASNLKTDWTKIKLDQTDSLSTLSAEKIFSLSSIIEFMRSYWYEKVVSPKSWEQSNVILSVLSDYWYSTEFINNFTSICRYLELNGFEKESFGKYVSSIVADESTRNKLITSFHDYWQNRKKYS